MYTDWKGKNFSFFQNTACEYFPCHDVEPDGFNCLFCFCPLYGRADCGGAFTRLGNGVKDCGACVFPHDRGNYGRILEQLGRRAKEGAP